MELITANAKMQQALGAKVSYGALKNFVKETMGLSIRRPYEVSEREDSTRIAHISMIIKDGVKNLEELVAKLSVDSHLEKKEAQRIIDELKAEQALGYYLRGTTIDGDQNMIFVEWNGEERAFEETRDYLKPKYFKVVRETPKLKGGKKTVKNVDIEPIQLNMFSFLNLS